MLEFLIWLVRVMNPSLGNCQICEIGLMTYTVKRLAVVLWRLSSLVTKG